MMNSTDEALVGRMVEGDEAAFTELYRRHQQSIYRFSLHMSASAAAAEDVTQEAFLTLMERGRDYDPARGAFTAFLFGIARNHVLRWLRANRKLVQVEETLEAVHPGQDQLRDLTRRENIELLRRMIVSLPARYREMVVLCDLHEMGYEEAAEAAGCSVGTVRSRLHRGRAMLEEKLRALEASRKGAQGGTSYELRTI